MKIFLVRTLLVVFFLSISGVAFAKVHHAGFRASYKSDSVEISMTTPEDWVYFEVDPVFKRDSMIKLDFSQEDKPEQDNRNIYSIFVIIFESASSSAAKYVKNNIGKEDGHKIKAKKIGIKLDNATNWKDYGVYELSGHPDKNKDLMLVVQTKRATILVVLSCALNKNANNNDFQNASTGFYELIKTIELNEIEKPFPINSPASFECGDISISMNTPAGWICDLDFAKAAKKSLGFLEEDAYSDGIDLTHVMFVESFKGHSVSVKKYVKNDIAYKKKQEETKVKAKKLNVKLDNAQNWKDYRLYEWRGIPDKYKELTLIIQTDEAIIRIVYSYNDHGDFACDPKGLEKDFQEHAAGFYEMIKTIKIREK